VLTLDHHERNASVRQLDCVSMPKLMRREATPHTRRGSRVMQLFARGRYFPAGARPSVRESRIAALRSGARGGSQAMGRVGPTPSGPSRPRGACRPSPPDEHCAAGPVQIALLQGKRFTDAESGAPEQHDQRTNPVTVRAIADHPHDGDDLLDRRRDRPGTPRPCCAVGGLGDSRALSPVSGGALRRSAERIP
jgi:hypothetical protein